MFVILFNANEIETCYGFFKSVDEAREVVFKYCKDLKEGYSANLKVNSRVLQNIEKIIVSNNETGEVICSYKIFKVNELNQKGDI